MNFKKIIKEVAAVMLGSFLLGGCSFFNEPRSPAERELSSPALPVEWMVDAGHGTGRYYLDLSPGFSNPMVYVGSYSGGISAVEVVSGSVLWNLNARHPIGAGIVATEDRVFIGTRDAQLLAFDAHTGALAWQRALANEVLSTPVVAGSLVIVKAQEGHVYAFDAETGKSKWHYQESMPLLFLRRESSPLVFGDHVLVGFPNGQLIDLQKNTGRLVWRQTIEAPHGQNAIERLVDIAGAFQAYDGAVYVVGFQGHLKALRLTDGHILWERSRLPSYTGLAVDHERVYVSDMEGKVWAFQRADGKLSWQQDILKGLEGLSQPVLIGEPMKALVVADQRGCIHVLDRIDGHLVNNRCLPRLLPPRQPGRSRRDTHITATPVVLQDKILVYMDNGNLFSIRLMPEKKLAE